MLKKDYAISGFIIVLIVLLIFLWLTPSGQPQAPQASFMDLQGRQFTLEQLRGKAVVVNFWATTCPGCVAEIPALVALSQKYTPQDLIIVGVAMDYDPESQVREMVRQKDMDYPIVLDSTGELAKAFGNVTLTPTTFFITRQGTIFRQVLGEISHSELENIVQGLLL